MDKLRFYVVSHTHWDREWYLPFQKYRSKLVYMIDDLLGQLEKNKSYKYFHMDGQTVVLEDYLKIRPENEERLRRLIGQGRIIIGPWYVMPDEFLVSGESLVRNLQRGFSLSGDFGTAPMNNGYVVDIFGHNSQFPQILRGFGIDSALLYRGIGDYPRDSFIWRSPEGSGVLCLKMDGDKAYSDFYFGIRAPFQDRDYDRTELLERIRHMAEFSRSRAVSHNILMLDGVDHIDIEPLLPELIETINAGQDEVELIHCRLEDYISEQKKYTDKMEIIEGELYTVGRVGPCNRINKNVLSSMAHIKQLNNECETLLTRWAEPFGAFAGQDNEGFLKEAWTFLLKNHPHDSICGCSLSRVHEDNIFRFNQVFDIADDLIKKNFSELSKNINTAGAVESPDKSVVFFNGSQTDHDGVLETDIDMKPGSQGNFRIYDSVGTEIPYQILSVNKGVVRNTTEYRHVINTTYTADCYRVLLRAKVPALGYSVFFVKEFRSEYKSRSEFEPYIFNKPVRYLGSMQKNHNSFENDFLVLTVNPNGTLNVLNKVTGKLYRDLLTFEDCGDVGDGWKLIPPRQDSRYLSTAGKADYSVESDGPLGAVFKIVNYMMLPVSAAPDETRRSAEHKELRIVTYVCMLKDSPVIRFNTYVENTVIDHRLRVLFPTYIDSEKFCTSTPFYLQERSVKPIDWSEYWEPETGVWPNQGLALIKDERDAFALYNKGLYEVAVTPDESRMMALTLFRSFHKEAGSSRAEMGLMLRKMDFYYAADFSAADADFMLRSDSYRTGIKTFDTSVHGGQLPKTLSFLSIDIPGAVLSCFVRVGKMTVFRLFNCSLSGTRGRVTFFKAPERACLLNLNNEVTGEISVDDSGIELQMRPGEILSVGLY